ncbi:hypothetical protein [Metabacillus sp. 84]|uniref:hypothetical protein n=1 Tax=Metabacillus sp. 84 TaxID=3404705 RepID=UPI003CF96C03
MAKKRKSLNDFAKALMYFCLKLKRENHFPVPLINYNATDNFWEKIQWDERFQGIYSFELVELFICNYMLVFPKQTVNKTDVENFLDDLESYLKNNLEEYWLIAPLTGALLSKEIIVSDNLIFLDGNKEEAQEYLKKLIGERFYNYITEKRFNTDYKDVLIAYKIKCQAEYIGTYYNFFAFYLNALVHLYYYANVYPYYEYKTNIVKYRMNSTFSLPLRSSENMERIILSSQRNPMLRVARHQTDCELDLSFFEHKENLTNFIEMMKYLLKEIPTHDKLINKFLNSVKIFKSALSVEDKDIFTGISITIVLLSTASEALLLKHSDIKRESLKAIFSSIYEGDDFSSNQVKEIVEKIYTLRSEFVHGGTFTYMDFNSDFSDGNNTRLLNDFKRVFCKSVYQIIEEILKLNPTERTIDFYEEYINSQKEIIDSSIG